MSIINFKYRLLLIFLSICFVHLAQKSFELEIIDFHYNEEAEKFEINYDIKKFKENETYKIRLDLIGNKSNKPIKSISGDYKMLSGNGGTKTMFWSQKKDGYTFDDEIAFGLSISLDDKVHIPYTSHIVKSLIIPGLGDYKIRKGKYYFLYGLVGYGSLGASYYFNKLYKENYAAYESSFEFNESNELFNKAKTQKNLNIIFGLTAGLVWTLDVSTLIGRVVKVKNELETDKLNPEKKTYYYNRSVRDEQFVSSPKYINTKEQYEKEFDLAMEEYDNKNWQDALKYFEKSKSLKPSKEILDRINKLIPITKNEIAYLQAIEMADNYFDNEQYKKALAKYKKATSLKANEDYPKKRIDETNKKITLNTNYDKAILAGNNYFDKGDYKKAKQEYIKAQNIKPNSAEATDKIEFCDNKKKFDQFVTTGDNQKTKGNLEDAILSYEKAQKLISNNTSLNKKIKDLKNSINEEENQEKAENSYNRAKAFAILALNDMDRYQKAIEEYNKALQYVPNYKDAKKQKMNCFFNRANIYREKDQYQKAIDDYDSTLHYDPAHKYATKRKDKCIKNIKLINSKIDYQTPIVLYKDPVTKVEVSIMFYSGSCNKDLTYKYIFKGDLGEKPLFIEWGIEYKDCDENPMIHQNTVPFYTSHAMLKEGKMFDEYLLENNNTYHFKNTKTKYDFDYGLIKCEKTVGKVVYKEGKPNNYEKN